MAQCEAGCGLEADEGYHTCRRLDCAVKVGLELSKREGVLDEAAIAASDAPGTRYHADARDLCAQLDARALFLVVLDGERGSDFDVVVRADADAGEAELWARRLLAQVRRVARRCERTLDAPHKVPSTRPRAPSAEAAEPAPTAGEEPG